MSVLTAFLPEKENLQNDLNLTKPQVNALLKKFKDLIYKQRDGKYFRYGLRKEFIQACCGKNQS